MHRVRLHPSVARGLPSLPPCCSLFEKPLWQEENGIWQSAGEEDPPR
ncbi:unnamed protein product [Gulo gulo]|uniref:Uncharacterized protein n=1 Tax=Gulo gulo TaxID=48420 RepID=A0A9X9LXR1_GULGU|nr:unnamed protein product [Gulo gulo]